jgi:glutamate-1-semialdehyde 2,1-aminomutase
VTEPSAISHWPDIDAIERRCQALIRKPPRGLRPDRASAVRRWFEDRTPTSRRDALEAARYIPGGVQHNLAFNRPWALNICGAGPAHLIDVDDNRYIDFLAAGGPTLLGNNYEPVRSRVIELLHEAGPVTGLFHSYEVELARLICDLVPGVDQFRMLGSGTEGVMAAIRAARAFTGASEVIKVGGAYHGWSDQLVYGLRLPGTGALEATGIPPEAYAHTQEVWPNDIDALRELLAANRDRGGTAAVIVEPLGPESATRPVTRDYNERVREACDEFGALLVFDEVVTGFRVGLGGAQSYLGVRPDLTVFGKAVAGGYPAAGGVGGRADVMAVFAGGLSAVGRRAFVGGTLAANPLSCVAGYVSIRELARTGAPVLAGRAGDRLARGLQRLIAGYDLPYVVYNFGSIVHLHTSGVLHLDLNDPAAFAEIDPRKELLEDMGAAFTAEGVITLAGSRIYTTMAHTDAVIHDALHRFERVFAGVEGVEGYRGLVDDLVRSGELDGAAPIPG